MEPEHLEHPLWHITVAWVKNASTFLSDELQHSAISQFALHTVFQAEDQRTPVAPTGHELV